MADTRASRQASNGKPRSDAERAEELVEEWGRRAGRLLARVAARAREEAEDIWAEAQAVRDDRAGER